MQEMALANSRATHLMLTGNTSLIEYPWSPGAVQAIEDMAKALNICLHDETSDCTSPVAVEPVLEQLILWWQVRCLL